MPKRTNAFQRLILRIYKQMTVPSANVEESAIVNERGSDVKREIDILLQMRMFETDIRIAVECRGRKNRDDIEWIDSLVGKYRDLDIDKVIAVSRSGFTRGATKKAAANRIEALTLNQALETNWPEKFTRLGVAQLTRHDAPDSVRVTTTPILPFRLTPRTKVFAENGEAVGTIEQIAQAIYKFRQEDLNRMIGEQCLDLFKTVGDIKTKQIMLEMTQKPVSPSYIKGENEVRFYIESVTLRMKSSFSAEPVNVEHYILGEAQATLAIVGPANHPFSVMAVQVSDKPGQARVNIVAVNASTVPK